MTAPDLSALIAGLSALASLCLAAAVGLISPKRFSQLVGGVACGVVLVCAGARLFEGGHG